MNYNYSKNDQLRFPQKYQRTSFEGGKFLFAYQKSRKSYIKKMEDKITKHKNFEEIIKNFDVEKNKGSDYITKLTLILILKENFPLKNKIINMFIKKFEIKKKIFSSYNKMFVENSLDYHDMINYVLLSNICIKEFEKTKNLKFLNVVLKLNDLICSEIENIKEDTELNLALHCLKKELNFIFEIKRRFSI